MENSGLAKSILPGLKPRFLRAPGSEALASPGTAGMDTCYSEASKQEPRAERAVFTATFQLRVFFPIRFSSNIPEYCPDLPPWRHTVLYLRGQWPGQYQRHPSGWRCSQRSGNRVLLRLASSLRSAVVA